ncbi:hypothetical protein [Pseudomonas aeruginosa]|uniref:hypothetical protein n=1 Tax=Pseudomonas aeruginosa TaxID=287 RepID=UPI0011533795|nr:hypothetical protein [Pseudomonas aeruginosa]MBS9731055.1 hypothetical protein [Pseudomonas aeruginosa]TQH48511.1 hypothetical protein FLI59_32110 [Pseudomonas aeruginosa]
MLSNNIITFEMALEAEPSVIRTFEYKPLRVMMGQLETFIVIEQGKEGVVYATIEIPSDGDISVNIEGSPFSRKDTEKALSLIFEQISEKLKATTPPSSTLN